MQMNANDVTQTQNAKKGLKRTALVLLVLFIILLAALIYYLFTQRPPITALPIGVKTAPRYVESFSAEMVLPTGIAVNGNGSRVYVVDTGSQTILMFDRDGKLLKRFGSPAKEGKPGEMAAPLFAACGPKGEVYVTDREMARIHVFSATGEYTADFTPDETEFTWSPLAIAIQNNKVYVTDAKKDEHRVLVMDMKGKILLKFGKQGSGKGMFNFPNGISVDADGNIYVADTNSARVQVFDKKGKLTRVFAGSGDSGLSHPVGIDATRSGEVHVVESFGHIVNVFSPMGSPLYRFGGFGLGTTQLRFPQGIAIASDNRVYVVDRDNKRIQVWQY